MKPDKSQTPAPKVSSKTDFEKDEIKFTKTQLEAAKKGAAKKTSATKTAQKIQDGDISRKNK